MQHTATKTLLGTLGVVVVTLCVSMATWSRPHGPDGEHSPDPGRMLEHMSKKLELTDEQESAISALMRTSFEDSSVDRERVHQLRETLQGQLQEFNEHSAREATDEIGDITARMAYRMASTQAGIYQLLSEEQRAEMEGMMEKRAERRGHRRERMLNHFE